MRLAHLTLQGFGAFRDRVDLDFSDVDFFALVGNTGAGKSTVIDGICFALYGTVPRYEDRRLVRHAVSAGASEARVSLAFDLGPERYVATRVVRRTTRGQVTTKEARLERGEEVVAGTERELTDAVERLLGLRFEDFTRCVALPQGDFAQFLRAKGDERRGLLLRLLNLGVYERVGEQARRRAAEHKAAANAHRLRLDDLAWATGDALGAAGRTVEALERLDDGLDVVLAELDDLQGQITRAAEAEQEATSALAALAGIAVPQGARRLGAELADGTAQVAAAAAQVDEREGERRAAEVRREALPEPGVLQVALAAHDAVERLGRAADELAAHLTGAASAATEAAHAVEQRDTEVARMEDGLERARRSHAASELAATLGPGDPCPVCLRPLDSLPEHPPAPELDQARSALDRARTGAMEARRRQVAADQQVHTLEARLGEARHLLSEAEEAVVDQPDRARVQALLGEVTEARTAEREARRAEDEARQRWRRLGARHAELARSGEQLQRAFDRQRDAVAALGPPAPGRVDLLDDWDRLAAWASAGQRGQEQARREAGEAAERLGERHRTALSRLRAELSARGVQPPRRSDASAFTAAVATALAQARAELVRIGDAIAERQRLEDRAAESDADAAVADQLGLLLRSNAFPDWLVAEALEVLAADASAIVQELTGGRYSLVTTDKEFEVLDHANADEARPARSLSGGETFQASLALALALSRQIANLAAEGAPRLDAILLDEGFGTLDPETLEVVAGTIERLGTSGRMVGVITHVRELAERVPVRFEVRKGARTSTVEKVVL